MEIPNVLSAIFFHKYVRCAHTPNRRSSVVERWRSIREVVGSILAADHPD